MEDVINKDDFEVEYPELDESGIIDDEDQEVEVNEDNEAEPEAKEETEGEAEQESEGEQKQEVPTEEQKEEKKRQSPEENRQWRERRLKWEAREKKLKEETEKLDGIMKPYGAKSYDEFMSMSEVKLDEATIRRLREEALDKGIDEDFYIENFKVKQELKLFKAQAEARAVESARKAAQEARIQEDITDFQRLYPEVSVAELMQNPDFQEINEGVLGTKPLVECYERYLKYQGRIAEAAKDKAARLLAKQMASTGSLKGTSAQSDSYYTLEQLKKMTPEQLEANWEKVEKSYAKIFKQ